MPDKPRLFELSPSELRARADECRTIADLEPSSRLAASVLKLADKYESMARKLEGGQNPPSIIIWERRPESYVAFGEAPLNRSDFVLNVKLRPDETWDWVVRRPGQLAAVVSGTARTVQEAMWESERAAFREWQ
jgi:hypothetical protein